jgi:hypothetical protein
MKNKLEKQIKKLDKKLDEISRRSAKGMEGLKEYEPYAVVLLAFLIIFSGLSVSMLEKNSFPTGFVVIDTTSPLEAGTPASASCREEWFCTEWAECPEGGIAGRECLDFNGCNTEYAKPDEAMECEPVFVAGKQEMEDKDVESRITGFAASPADGVTTDLLLVLIYAIAVISLLIVASYAYMAYIQKTVLHHSLAAAAYWLAMAGLPLSIYFTVTRDQYIVPAYIAFGLVTAAFLALMMLKPWEIKGLPELRHVDMLLESVSENAGYRFSRIKKGRREREKLFREFRDTIRAWNTQRDLRLMGADQLEIRGLDKEIAGIVKKGPQIRMEVAEIENAVREREHRFAEMNRKLAIWADERRRAKLEKEIGKKKEKAAEKAKAARKKKEEGENKEGEGE